nr:hypothetical protein [Tanacetum cinerariifolium]GFB26186.1 hypothetical protein [Tanacetum cinerariifolium]
MGDENPICTLRDYSKPSHEGYRNTIELPVGNNVVPLRSDTIRFVQNECSFRELRSEDPNQHLKDFLKLVDLLDLDGENRERTCLRLFQFSLRDQAINWLERLPAHGLVLRTYSKKSLTWHQLMASNSNLLRSCRRHHSKGIDYATGGRLEKLRPDKAWATIERVVQYEDEGWDDAFILEKKSLN